MRVCSVTTTFIKPVWGVVEQVEAFLGFVAGATSCHEVVKAVCSEDCALMEICNACFPFRSDA